VSVLKNIVGVRASVSLNESSGESNIIECALVRVAGCAAMAQRFSRQTITVLDSVT
jgi:hypothetical protein